MLLNVISRLRVALGIAVAQIVAFVDDDQIESRHVFQLRQSAQRQSFARDGVIVQITIPHSSQFGRADKKRVAAVIFLANLGDRAGDDGFAKPDHIADNHAAATVEPLDRQFDRHFLEFEEFASKIRRNRKIVRAFDRLARNVIRALNVNLVRRGAVARPTLGDNVGQRIADIDAPFVFPTGVEPARKFRRRVAVQDIDIQFALFFQTGESQVAAAQKSDCRIHRVVAMRQIQLGVQRMAREKFRFHFAVLQLLAQPPQRGFVGGGGETDRQLLGEIVDFALFAFEDDFLRRARRLHSIQPPDRPPRILAHADDKAATFAVFAGQIVDRIDDSAPPAKIKIADAKIRAPRRAQSVVQPREEFFLDVVVNRRHSPLHRARFAKRTAKLYAPRL